ncbi:MAG TPA: M20/M25/M40 family metallo-hydrolase [Thermoanaerobaculia bacterium]|nr:M20/M25/M40 family metallo-hydrolase [Thermoanaerobaculia bacterium]
MELDLFGLTRALVDIESVTGGERAIAEYLEERLAALAGGSGGRVERMPVAEGRWNLFAAWGPPEVVLSTHLDTVPPFFGSSEDEDTIRGRGACDAKGAIAAMVCAAGELLAAGESGFGLLLVVGEETDGAGADAANRTPRGARCLINGEPTENRLAVGSKGALYLALEATGKMAHSAYPELGDSAIDKLLDALGRLRRLPLPAASDLGETTLNVGTLAGGRAANVVADAARAEVMIRTVGDTAELLQALFAALGSEVRASEVREVPALRLRALPGFATTVVKYTTDIPRLTAWGEPYLLGPGSIHVAHTPNEHVAKRDLLEAAGLYRDLVRRLKASPGAGA